MWFLILTAFASDASHRRHKVLVVPVAKTEPGAGFTTGARARYVYREPEDAMNRVTIDLVTRFSVRGVQQHDLSFTTRNYFGRGEVLGLGVRFDLDPVFSHVGLGNHAALTNREIRTQKYEAKRLSVSGNARGEFNVATWGQTAVRVFTGWNIAFDRFKAEAGSQLLADAPAALGEGRFRGTFYGGLVLDGRDNDWNPTRGGLTDVSVGAGGPWAGGAAVWGRGNVSVRRYVPLLESLTWASALLVEGQTGDSPLIPLGEFSGVDFSTGVGGADTGRGYFRRRFVGAEKAYASTELRWEPTRFHLFKVPVDLGFKPFVDAGFVGHEARRALHVSGGGGVYFVWDDFEVVRIDLGASPEGIVVVMAADHAF